MSEYLTVAEVYQMQHRLIDMFGGLHGVRDKSAVEAAVFRPQTGYYNSLEEEAAALMESLGNNHGFLDGNKGAGPSLRHHGRGCPIRRGFRRMGTTNARTTSFLW
jgi:prophage maintenance system killer protein